MFPFFPFTNFHEMNTDWVIKTIKAWEATMKEYAERVEAAVASIAHAVLTTAQTLTAEEQTQARTNISAASDESVQTLAMRIDGTLETLDGRIDATETSISGMNSRLTSLQLHSVQTAPQTFTTAEQTQARTNIGAASNADIGRLSSIQEYQQNQISDLELSDTAQETRLESLEAAAPHIVTLSRENNAYTLSESVTDVVGWIADGDMVIINAQGVDEYPNNPYPQAKEVQIADLKTATIAAADAVEGTVTLSIGTAQELKMTLSASAQDPDDVVNVSFQTVPIGGGSPVIVTWDTQTNTWNGATWAELYAAFQRNAAGLRFVVPGTSRTLIYWATLVAINQGLLALVIVAPEGASIMIVETGEIIYENP